MTLPYHIQHVGHGVTRHQCDIMREMVNEADEDLINNVLSAIHEVIGWQDRHDFDYLHEIISIKWVAHQHERVRQRDKRVAEAKLKMKHMLD